MKNCTRSVRHFIFSRRGAETQRTAKNTGEKIGHIFRLYLQIALVFPGFAVHFSASLREINQRWTERL